MDILIGIVIAFFIISAVYVGYHASQSPEMMKDHDIRFETFGFESDDLVSKQSQIMTTYQKSF